MHLKMQTLSNMYPKSVPNSFLRHWAIYIYIFFLVRTQAKTRAMHDQIMDTVAHQSSPERRTCPLQAGSCKGSAAWPSSFLPSLAWPSSFLPSEATTLNVPLSALVRIQPAGPLLPLPGPITHLLKTSSTAQK